MAYYTTDTILLDYMRKTLLKDWTSPYEKWLVNYGFSIYDLRSFFEIWSNRMIGNPIPHSKTTTWTSLTKKYGLEGHQVTLTSLMRKYIYSAATNATQRTIVKKMTDAEIKVWFTVVVYYIETGIRLDPNSTLAKQYTAISNKYHIG